MTQEIVSTYVARAAARAATVSESDARHARAVKACLEIGNGTVWFARCVDGGPVPLSAEYLDRAQLIADLASGEINAQQVWQLDYDVPRKDVSEDVALDVVDKLAADGWDFDHIRRTSIVAATLTDDDVARAGGFLWSRRDLEWLRAPV